MSALSPTKTVHESKQPKPSFDPALELLRKDILASVQSYETRFQQKAQAYRNERAWQVMLAIRKAYTLIVRDGWRGKANFLRWLFWDIPRGRANLAPFDLTFPDIWTFLPEALNQPWTEAPSNAVRPAAPTCRPSRHYDVVILPIFDFEFRFQRPQQIAVQFARAGHRVFWISPSRVLPHHSAASFELHRIRGNVWEVNLRVPRMDLYTGAMSEAQAATMSEALGDLLREATVAENCVLLQFPFWRKLGLALRERWASKVLYDCMDDWQNWPTEPLISAANLVDERKLVRECDVLTVTAKQFFDRYADNPVHPVLVPNAGDFAFFSSAPENGLLKDLPRPIIGYYGAIADWFDVDAIAAIARSRPESSVVLIGQVHGRDLSVFKPLRNVHLLGEKRYRELPSYLRYFDVCLIPFLVTKLTKGVDPVKMYEYFAQGKPVVASRMREIEAYGDLLHFADTPEDYVRAVDAALKEGEDKKTKRRDFAAANTWTDRFQVMDAAVRETFPLVSLIVVTYNTVEYLQPFWNSVRRNVTCPNTEIVFVDNNSDDGTREELRRIAAEDGRVHLHLLEQNLGFAGGNNVGVRESRGEYLMILNPDTILTHGCIERLLRPLRGSRIGMSAPVSNFSGNETRVATSYRNLAEMEEFAEQLARTRYGETRDVPVIPLFCGVLSRKLWDEVGGLDERFQVGMFEDDDFSLRIQELGFRTATAEDCFIHHFGNGSFAKLPSAASLRIFARNREAFEQKWGRTWQPHRTRFGVPPPGPADHLDIAAFSDWAERDTSQSTSAAVIRRLVPSQTKRGEPFNPQSGGTAALIVECEGATSDTSVLWNGQALETTYANPGLLTALVPCLMYASPGHVSVTLVNGDGLASAAMPFVVGD